MPDYKVGTVDGVKYRRCHRITIENPYMVAPSIAFSEQDLLTIANNPGPIKIPVGDLGTVMSADNLFEEFEVLDMEGNPSGMRLNFLQFYGIVNGLYRHFAAKRDAAEVAAQVSSSSIASVESSSSSSSTETVSSSSMTPEEEAAAAAAEAAAAAAIAAAQGQTPPPSSSSIG